MDDITVDELEALGESDFYEEVMEDLNFVRAAGSPFKDPRVVDRTHAALVDRLGFITESIVRKREIGADPTAAIRLRRHVISVLYAIEKAIEWRKAGKTRELSAWKDTLNKVLDEIEGDEEFDDILDEYSTPFKGMSLRDWLEVRRVKDPSRIPEWEDDVELAA